MMMTHRYQRKTDVKTPINALPPVAHTTGIIEYREALPEGNRWTPHNILRLESGIV